MKRAIAIANQKGGVGKTTTAVNLGACLAEEGARTLIVDIDPQGNSTSGLGIEKRSVEKSVYDVVVEGAPLEDVIVKSEVDGLDVAPATVDLAGAEIELVASISREKKLRTALDGLSAGYRFILIDCPPSLGLLTVNALAAADSILIPIQCEYYALEGLTQLMNTVRIVQRHVNPSLSLEGVVLTMYDGRTNLSVQVAEEVKRFFRDKVYRTVIPRNVRLSEAPSYGKPIVVYDARSRGAEVYRELAKEVIKGGKEGARPGA